jgi:hypothetical protein
MPTFYRIVKSNPPMLADFLSQRSLGRPLRRDTPEMRRSWEGVSVYDTLEAARETALRYPRIGEFIAEVQIPDNGPVGFEQTLADPHHYHMHGEPSDMLAMVFRVVSVVQR